MEKRSEARKLYTRLSIFMEGTTYIVPVPVLVIFMVLSLLGWGKEALCVIEASAGA
jgi:hypothetical protein